MLCLALSSEVARARREAWPSAGMPDAQRSTPPMYDGMLSSRMPSVSLGSTMGLPSHSTCTDFRLRGWSQVDTEVQMVRVLVWIMLQ